jgi:hypothetical protein
VEQELPLDAPEPPSGAVPWVRLQPDAAEPLVAIPLVAIRRVPQLGPGQDAVQAAQQAALAVLAVLLPVASPPRVADLAV